ncbi:MAG: DUF4416 family protein [Candidatus Poribacteria bacterium]|nr:DUF4416 family protein [Candidatus Poribacteria bacterium]MDE0506563.1 DUF4416 family protein [Candidatus Poribacteria bacterium]
MGQIKPASPVKLIVGVITANAALLDAVYLKLEDRFSEIDFASQFMPFDYTAYYSQEMGRELQRQFVSFEQLVPPDELAAAKRFSNTVECQFAESETARRRVNLDPGYISAAKLILASTKDHAHRIHLQNGIYAENTLRFRNKTFQPWEWTYPDYRTPAYIEIFNHIREIYLGQLKARGLRAHPD